MLMQLSPGPHAWAEVPHSSVSGMEREEMTPLGFHFLRWCRLPRLAPVPAPGG